VLVVGSCAGQFSNSVRRPKSWRSMPILDLDCHGWSRASLQMVSATVTIVVVSKRHRDHLAIIACIHPLSNGGVFPIYLWYSALSVYCLHYLNQSQ
jgi:hypothetical protein